MVGLTVYTQPTAELRQSRGLNYDAISYKSLRLFYESTTSVRYNSYRVSYKHQLTRQ